MRKGWMVRLYYCLWLNFNNLCSLLLLVVAGIRTPLPISTLKDSLPVAYDQLIKNVNILEKHYGDMQVR
jgi:hypothetical protein